MAINPSCPHVLSFSLNQNQFQIEPLGKYYRNIKAYFEERLGSGYFAVYFGEASECLRHMKALKNKHPETFDIPSEVFWDRYVLQLNEEEV